jgi:hypothetical protein
MIRDALPWAVVVVVLGGVGSCSVLLSIEGDKRRDRLISECHADGGLARFNGFDQYIGCDRPAP